LRLWSARATNEFDLDFFQNGDYLRAVEQKNVSENISKVLYPDESTAAGKELRLKQQYFFVSCSIQDIVRRFLAHHAEIDQFPEKAAIQLNDTHPSLSIPELMRILIDDHGVPFDRAMDLTSRACAYTNHTLLPEALEEWPVGLFERLLPRHLQIIRQIDARLRTQISLRFPGDAERARRVAIVTGGERPTVRMAHLAVVGTHSTNGVAGLHTRLLRENVLHDFDELYPGRINSKTNGVTPRRWLLAANPGLSGLISARFGDDWIKDLSQLQWLEPLAGDAGFREEFSRVKRGNKERLAAAIGSIAGVRVDPESIFDVQVKRIHEYKRQLLNILHVVHAWLRMKEEPGWDPPPRTWIFAGKAAPDYVAAKLIIRLINHVAAMLNADTGDPRIRVVFLPNYRVSLAELIMPAADVSEQISTAGYEASGTGNMKLALNGALTVGTMDGANIEIRDEVGDENIFIFGMGADEVRAARGSYDPRGPIERDPLLRRTLDLIRDGFFSQDDPGLFRPLVEALTGADRYLVLADFESYRGAQERVGREYLDRESWTRKAILNVARSGRFSSDRTISEYNRDIWRAQPLTIPMEGVNLEAKEQSFIDRD
ncbi:MAG: glycogen/starch/alpha-glucan phosphorylase, partial [Candidatus Krumholzibacteria bacterium]|nr:glycogen/starch/alpha-glucan phosphorylase [Candidatus Krumholzibacteria bacterium]